MAAIAELETRPLYEIRHPEGPVVSVFRSPEETIFGGVSFIQRHNMLQPEGTDFMATGHTYELFLPVYVREGKRLGVDYSKNKFRHLDNFWWDPRLYSEPGPADYAQFVNDLFIVPAEIPQSDFFPINGFTDNPWRIALDYNTAINSEIIRNVFLGLGPLPETHLGYMRPNTPLEWGYHVVKLTDATTARNNSRNDNAPDWGITIGPKWLRSAQQKIVMAYTVDGRSRADEVAAALGPKDPSIVATMLQEWDNVHFFIDEASARKIQHLR